MKEKRPKLLFLMDTKLQNKRMQRLKYQLGFPGMFTVDPIGRSGGLALFWQNSEEVAIQNFSLRHINATVTLMGSNFSWKFTGFYGNPNRALQDSSWRLLSYLSQLRPEAWLCLGDFNEIADPTEKVGGLIRNAAQMSAFRDTLSECPFSDLGYKGSRFT